MKRNWEYKKLGDVCVSELGKTLNQSKDTGSLQPYLCAVNVQWDSLDFTTLKQARFEEDELERYSVQKNDLLVCEGGDVGRAAIWNQEKPMLYQNALHRLRFSNNCNPRFYLFCLKHLKNKGVLDGRYAKGVTIKHLVKSALLSIQVPVPPLSEQSRIVAELDLLTGIIDKQNAQLKELDNLAQAIFYDMFGDPIENPKGWEIKKLGDVTNKISDGVHAKPHYTESGMPFISVVNINRGKLNFEGCKFVSQTDGELFNKRTKPEKGDVLYTKVGATYGISALIDVDVEFCLYVSVCLIKPKREIFDSLFLTHMMRLPYVKNQADERIRGIGVPDLHLNQISAFNVILPPLALQQSFAEKIQSIEKQKETIHASIADTQKLLDYTMDKYFG